MASDFHLAEVAGLLAVSCPSGRNILEKGCRTLTADLVGEEQVGKVTFKALVGGTVLPSSPLADFENIDAATTHAQKRNISGACFTLGAWA